MAMRVTSLISSLALLGATTLAHPQAGAEQAESSGFEITQLVIDKVVDGNTSISFRLYNPDALSGAHATCTGTWTTAEGNPPEDYELCGESKLAWGFDAYINVNNFTLNVEDRFINPALGDPPYDRATVFGIVIFNETNLECEAMGDASCRTAKDAVIQVPIYATTA